MADAIVRSRATPNIEIIWASTREVFNVIEAHELGCHIITATKDVLAKLALVGKDLEAYSLETVEMFRRDALAAGFTIEEAVAPAGKRAAV